MDNNEAKNKIQEITDELEEPLREGLNPMNATPKNGDTVIFLIEKDDIVRVGKIVSDYNCIIAQDGIIYDDDIVSDRWIVPINRIQETIHYNGTFMKAYDNLVSMNTEEFKAQQIEHYINTRVVVTKGTLSDDKQFLVETFTRNVRKGSIDFKNYKFMMELLFDNPDNEYDNQIDLRNLKTICYNIFSIMNRISQETYDEIYAKLAEYNS